MIAYHGDVDAGPGEAAVTVRCKKCSRYWFIVVGTTDGDALRVVGYAERGWEPSTRRSTGFDTRNRNRTGTPRAALFRFQGPRIGTEEIIPGVKMPKYAYERLSIHCHRRCGRNENFVEETIVRRFREAVTTGHDTTTL